MRLLNLPVWLRAYGVPVVEEPGWRTRGAELQGRPVTVIGHHTATSNRARGDLPTLRLLVDGRPDLDGPLCQIGLSRSGVAHVIASGKANHAGPGAWRGNEASWLTVGIEVEHPGTGPWPERQLRAFDRVAAALCWGLDLPAGAYCGHREWALPAGRKPDPGGVDLDQQRQRIRRLLATGPHQEDTVTPQDRKAIVDDVVEALVQKLAHQRGRDAQGRYVDPDKQVTSIADLYTLVEVQGKETDERLAALEAKVAAR